MTDQIALASIRLDGGTQPRASIFEETLNAYIEDMAKGDAFPPVVLFFDGSDYWLADGFHRLHAAKAIQLADIAADVRQGTQRDAVLYSVGANHSHGRPRTNEDKRRAVMRLLADPEWVVWSDREIARACRVDHVTVGRLRPSPPSQVTVTGEFTSEPPRTYTTKHGTVATMQTANIGRASASPHSPPHRPTEPVMAPAPAAAPAPTAEQVAAFKATMAEDGPIADGIRAIVDAFVPLPEAAEAARRFPRVLRHTFSAAQARFISEWFADFALAWEQENGVTHVAAE